jgi:hypothetical protein
MSKMLSDDFRERAEEVRAAAEDAKTVCARRALLQAAERWERLAHQWEAWASLGNEPSNTA